MKIVCEAKNLQTETAWPSSHVFKQEINNNKSL